MAKPGAVLCPKRGAVVSQLVPKLKESAPPPPPGGEGGGALSQGWKPREWKEEEERGGERRTIRDKVVGCDKCHVW